MGSCGVVFASRWSSVRSGAPRCFASTTYKPSAIEIFAARVSARISRPAEASMTTGVYAARTTERWP
jgi:hypothetical protein